MLFASLLALLACLHLSTLNPSKSLPNHFNKIPIPLCMDPALVIAYLRSVCSVLGCDVGELWCARSGKKKSLEFDALFSPPLCC